MENSLADGEADDTVHAHMLSLLIETGLLDAT